MDEIIANLFKIEHNNIKPGPGKILISEPYSQDAYFKRSVVLLTEHSSEGSVGYILNKMVDIPISDAIDGINNFNSNLSVGGPVETNTIHFLHTLGEVVPASVKIYDNLHWGGDLQKIKQLIRSKAVKRNQIRFFLGYAGWEPGQLNREIDENYWLVSTAKVKDIMSFSNIWKKSLENLGDRYKYWVNFPENPALN